MIKGKRQFFLCVAHNNAHRECVSVLVYHLAWTHYLSVLPPLFERPNSNNLCRRPRLAKSFSSHPILPDLMTHYHCFARQKQFIKAFRALLQTDVSGSTKRLALLAPSRGSVDGREGCDCCHRLTIVALSLDLLQSFLSQVTVCRSRVHFKLNKSAFLL